MSEKQKLHTLLRLYEHSVERNQTEVKEERYLGLVYPVLDPRALLPTEFPDIKQYVKSLGKKPKEIRHDFESIIISFSSGEVFYVFDMEDFRYYPKSLSLKDPNNFNRMNETVTFELLRDIEIPEEGIDWNTHFLIDENTVLRVNLPEKDLLDIEECNGEGITE